MMYGRMNGLIIVSSIVDMLSVMTSELFEKFRDWYSFRLTVGHINKYGTVTELLLHQILNSVFCDDRKHMFPDTRPVEPESMKPVHEFL